MNTQQFVKGICLGLVTIIPLGIIGSNSVIGQTGINLSIFRNTALSQHNTYRNSHHSPDMTLSDSLNNSAQNWAEYLANNGVLEHSDSDAGENLYVSYTTASSVDAATLANQAVTNWYNEVSDYDYNNPGFSSETGHFTQVVWKNSTQLGCGAARGVKTIQGTQYNAFYVVCQYAPAGNVIGQFPENVMTP